MKPLFLLAFLLPVAALAQAPPAWQSVQTLKPGVLLRIQASRGRTDCAFTSADADTLHCAETVPAGLFSTPVQVEVPIQRVEIRSIRRRPHKLARAFTIAGATAGLVFAFATADPILAAPFAVVFGLFGLVAGGAVDLVADLAPHRALYLQP